VASKHHIGRFRQSGENQVGQEQTGDAQSRKLTKTGTLSGKRHKQWFSTENNGVVLWLNTSTWTQLKKNIEVPEKIQYDPYYLWLGN